MNFTNIWRKEIDDREPRFWVVDNDSSPLSDSSLGCGSNRRLALAGLRNDGRGGDVHGAGHRFRRLAFADDWKPEIRRNTNEERIMKIRGYGRNDNNEIKMFANVFFEM